MYLIEFFKKVTQKANIHVFIYLGLNLLLITYLIHFFFMSPETSTAVSYGKAVLTSVILYTASLAIALSPIGEWILRVQTGCKKIDCPEQLARIEPIFREVYARAKELEPAIPDDVHIFINDDTAPNAFATGRKTICMTQGMLQMPEDQIKATLAHEFGQLAHKDTDLTLVVCVGNMIVSAMIFVLKFLVELIHIAGDFAAFIMGGYDGIGVCLLNDLYHFIITTVIAGLMGLWTWSGILLVRKSGREQEYEADAFSVRAGYGDALCMLLNEIGDQKATGLFAALASSHPSKHERIAKIRELQAM